MGVRRVGLCLQTLLVVLLSACARPPEDTESRYRLTVRARGLLENGDAASAAKLLERVANAKPRASAYVNLGLAQRARGEGGDAVRAWRRAVELEPQSVRALYHLATDLHERAQDDMREAQARPKKAAKLQSRASERLSEAQSLLERAAAADAFNAAIPRFLATLHFERGDSTAARAALREAERLDPGRAGLDDDVYGMQRIELPTLRRNVRISRTPPRFRARRTDARATFLEVFDVGGDGIDDLVVGDRGALLRVTEPQSQAGTVGKAVPWLARRVVAMQTGLFDADRVPDVVVFTPARSRLARRGAKLEAWLVRGRAHRDQPESLGVVDHDVRDAETVDVDADGDADLVLATSVAPGVRVWRNDGGGRFEPDAAVEGLAQTSAARAVTCGDLDADGRAELIWIDAQHQVRVLGARKTGYVDASARSALNGQRARAVVCSDVDADGDLDVLLGDDEGLWLWNNRGAGRLERSAAYRETNSAWSSRSPRGVAISALYLADLDNDGFEDVLSLHFPEREPEFATTSESVAGDEDTSPASRRVVPLLDVPPVSRLALWRNQGGGAFGDLGEVSGVNGMPLLSAPPRALDLDADGDLDVACVGPDSVVRVLWNLEAPKYRRLEIELIHERRPSLCRGARVELYANTGVRKAILDNTFLHIGVGNTTGAEVLRIVWPDGYVENHFDVEFPKSHRLQLTRRALRAEG